MQPRLSPTRLKLILVFLEIILPFLIYSALRNGQDAIAQGLSFLLSLGIFVLIFLKP